MIFCLDPRIPIMLEYMFFDAALRDRFVARARELGVACALSDASLGLVAAVPEDLPADTEAELEACYDALQDEEARQVDASDGEAAKHVAGFRLDLPDGRSTTVPVAPDVAQRLMACFSFEEIHALFATVARHALDPHETPLCKVKLDA